MASIGEAAWKLSFELSPIILNNGIAAQIPGGMLPIIALTQAVSFATGLLSGGDLTDLDSYFAHFKPAAGATLIENAIGKYPFASQVVAANAIIAQPLRVSMIMDCPARGPFAYFTKLATLTALQATLSAHSNLGGTYTVLTPTYFYTNTILTGLREVGNPDSKQPQIRWQFDFEKPLLTEEQAQQAQNNLMNKLTNGLRITGQPSWSTISNAVGLPPSLATLSLAPSASGTAASSVANGILQGTP